MDYLVCLVWVMCFGIPMLELATYEIEWMGTEAHWSDIPGEVL